MVAKVKAAKAAKVPAKVAKVAQAAKEAAGVQVIDDASIGVGYAWAQRAQALIVQHQGAFTALAHELWAMTLTARNKALDTLKAFQKQARDASKAPGMRIGPKGEEWDAAKWGKVARVTGVRLSQLVSIVTAMNGNPVTGPLTLAKFAKLVHKPDPEAAKSVAVEILYQVARDWNGTRAAQGRTADTAQEKLAKFLQARVDDAKTDEDRAYFTKVHKVLVANHIDLPALKVESPEQKEGKAKLAELQKQMDALKAGLKPKTVTDKTPRRVKAKVAGAPDGIERRVEDAGLPAEGERRVH